MHLCCRYRKRYMYSCFLPTLPASTQVPITSSQPISDMYSVHHSYRAIHHVSETPSLRKTLLLDDYWSARPSWIVFMVLLGLGKVSIGPECLFPKIKPLQKPLYFWAMVFCMNKILFKSNKNSLFFQYNVYPFRRYLTSWKLLWNGTQE